MGFCTSTEVVTYLHNLNRGGKKGFVVTDDFMPSGSLTLKGFPISKASPPGFRSRFDILVQETRVNGQLADLHRQYIHDADGDGSNKDIAVDGQTHLGVRRADVILALRIGNAIFYGVAFFATGVLYWLHISGAHKVAPTPENMFIPPRSNGETFSWKGTTYEVPEEHEEISYILKLVLSRVTGISNEEHSPSPSL